NQKGLQRGQLFRCDRETRRHCVAAAIDQQPRLARRDDRGAERQSGDRAARTSADAIGERDDASRALVTLFEACSDDPDHPGVPILGRGKDEDGRLRRSFDQADCRLQGARLDLAALAVVGVETRRKLGGNRRIVGCKQARAEIGAADPPAGIDPRTEHKAEMIGVMGSPMPATAASAARPGLSRRRATLVPWATRARLTPASGTTSQTVPSATRSSHCNRSGSVRAASYQPARRSSRLTATANKKATPTAANAPCGLLSSSRFGLTTATARGSNGSAT